MDLEVRRTDLRDIRLVEHPVPVPAEGQVLLHVDHCALTANNVTYGAFGDIMGYWRFFPTDDGWGRIPVWGFADVEASTVEGIADGERVYGYFPMSTHLLVTPSRVTPTGFVDAAPHRAELPPVYNQYTRVTERTARIDEQAHAVLRPLFTTSFLIDDWLAAEDRFGAAAVVIASASSKTALALAESLRARGGCEVIGLTSARNLEFVVGLGYYDRVVTYDDIASLDPTVRTVLVDMGGDGAVRADVHRHFGDALAHSCSVGATHWEQLGAGGGPLPGPPPTLFFAPDHVQRRIAEWGGAGFEERVGVAWERFAASARTWLTIVEHRGPAAVAAAYTDVVDGKVAPSEAYAISLDEPV